MRNKQDKTDNWQNILNRIREIIGSISEFIGRNGKILMPGITVLLVVMMFCGALMLDGNAEAALLEETAEMGQSIEISDAVYISSINVETEDNMSAVFDADEIVYEGEETDIQETEEERDYYKKGDSDTKVAEIQSRLMKLGYMDQDEPTEYYGSATRTAVERFQMKNGLEIDGNAGEQTLTLLFSSDAKKYSMILGMRGEDISELQKRLRNLGYLDSSATGYFGDETESAVKEFQKKNGLTSDGSAGHDTIEKLYAADVTPNYIGSGEEGDEVLSLQKKLKKLGYLTTEPDGKYGPDTVRAVKRFQESNGLIVDGYFGYDTKVLLNSGKAEANAFAIGDSGEQVRNIQERLVALKYMKKATGYYGETTDDAVRSFQDRNGLTSDGKVGQKTLKVLFSDSAKKASTSSSSSSKKSTAPKSTKSSKPTSTKKEEVKQKESSKEKVKVTGANASSLISVAKTKLGCKYVRGGKGPDTFDCSGFVYWCLRQIGVNISYMTSSGWKSCTKYETVSSLSSVKAGDIIVFNGHVGIAMGDGKMIDASSSDGCIRIANLSNNYWKTNFIKACRLF